MRRVFYLVLALSLIFLKTSFAAEAKAKTANDAPTAVVTQAISADDKKRIEQTLSAQLQELDNNQARVIVLQQLFNEEAAKLRQQQLLFCDIYKLDVEKWRQGFYQYDSNQGKFVEKQPKPKEA